MPTLKKIPNWIINADKDLLKYKPVEKLVPEEPVISNDEEAKAKVTKVKEKKPTKKKVVIDEYSSDEEFYKPKKKKIPKKKKYESESEEDCEDSDESNESNESDYEARISKCKNLKKYFKK